MGIINDARAKAQQEAEAIELHNAMQGRALMESIARQRMQPQVVDVTPRSPGLAQDIYERDYLETVQGARPQAGGRLPNAEYTPEQFRQKFNLQGR